MDGRGPSNSVKRRTCTGRMRRLTVGARGAEGRRIKPDGGRRNRRCVDAGIASASRTQCTVHCGVSLLQPNADASASANASAGGRCLLLEAADGRPSVLDGRLVSVGPLLAVGQAGLTYGVHVAGLQACSLFRCRSIHADEARRQVKTGSLVRAWWTNPCCSGHSSRSSNSYSSNSNNISDRTPVFYGNPRHSRCPPSPSAFCFLSRLF